MRTVLRKLLLVAALVAVFIVVLAPAAFAQTDGSDLDAALAFLAAAAIPLLAGSRGITFLVDRVRDAVGFGDDPRFKIVWGLLALAIALIATLGFGVNTIGDLVAALPQGTNALSGTAGEIITAIVYAGLASSWHDRDVAKNPPTPG